MYIPVFYTSRIWCMILASTYSQPLTIYSPTSYNENNYIACHNYQLITICCTVVLSTNNQQNRFISTQVSFYLLANVDGSSFSGSGIFSKTDSIYEKGNNIKRFQYRCWNFWKCESDKCWHYCGKRACKYDILCMNNWPKSWFLTTGFFL
jgi:hypothetical protein